MALVLSVEKGGCIYVGKHNPTKIVVEQVMSAQRFKLRVVGPAMDTLYTITNRFTVPILPRVNVSAGKGTSVIAKLNIEAPRSIYIIRGDLTEEEVGSGEGG